MRQSLGKKIQESSIRRVAMEIAENGKEDCVGLLSRKAHLNPKTS